MSYLREIVEYLHIIVQLKIKFNVEFCPLNTRNLVRVTGHAYSRLCEELRDEDNPVN